MLRILIISQERRFVHGTGYKRALRLTAAKSTIGHAEPAAGTIGIAHVMSMMPYHLSTTLKHLRNMNPVVLSALKLGIEGCLTLPRQATPIISASMGASHHENTCGMSSFAFQGTNAHIVLGMKRRCRGNASCRTLRQDILWSPLRHWFTGPSHQLLNIVACSRPQCQAAFEVSTSRASLGEMNFIQVI